MVSIDLIIEDVGEYLLGYRTNRPASGSWFVPGGRILKDENLETAFKRIISTETGCIDRTATVSCSTFKEYSNIL
ncbi:NUDIX domain-containing protein [Sodalis ligni]|uniref:NUDIX domain-containing protein n=1 Tax=Sodalis ligni TaxID=2697027 RepID=UPI0030B83788